MRYTSFGKTENVGCDRRIAIKDEFQSEITFKNGRYEVKMPFKDEHAILPDNYALPNTRLTNLMRKLKSNPSLAAEYQQVIKSEGQRATKKVYEIITLMGLFCD